MSHNIPPRVTLTSLLVALAVLASPVVDARNTDRSKAMENESGMQQGTLDDSTPTVLSGGVTIDQGTLHAEAARAEISTRSGNISRVLLTGSPARLRQELDDGTPMSAVASRIDYNVSNETVVFTGNVDIQQPRGSLAGERVVYNMSTGQVTSGGQGNGRVKMRILPKTGAGAETPPDDAADADNPAEGG